MSTSTRTLNFRAVWLGAVVDMAGSLAMTTIIGLTAVTAMLVRGDSAQSIVDELPKSFALVLFCAAAGVMMSLAGGYVAARIASHAPLRHAFWAGVLSALLNVAIVALLGDSGPVWLTASSTMLILPCATIGGWLAMPVATAPVPTRG